MGYGSMNRTDQEKGLRYVLYDGILTQAMVSLSGGAFIIAFALLFEASNLAIGLLAAGPFLGNIFQIPAVFLVEKFRKRRLIAATASFISRIWLLVYALIPLLFARHALSLLSIGIFVAAATAAFSTCSWSSWMRDLVPDNERGRFFSKRMTLSLVVVIPLSIVAGRFIDYYASWFPQHGIYGYSILFLIAFAFGIVGSLLLRLTPEPPMAKETQRPSPLHMLRSPFRDENFRRLMGFTVLWAIAFNFAVPFFVVYMFKRLSLSLTAVITLSVISQLFYLVFLRVWGSLTDRYSNKSVMQLSGAILLGCIIVWPFTTLPEVYPATIPLLTFVHILSGVALAGVFIASFNIAFKLSPPSDATTYLAVNGALVSMGMGLGPILGGLLADTLKFMELSLTFRWLTSRAEWTAYLANFRGLDFLFFIAFILGIIALNRLSAVQEKGEVPKKIIYQAFLSETRRTMRNISSLGGVASLGIVPIYSRLRVRSHSRPGTAKSLANSDQCRNKVSSAAPRENSKTNENSLHER